MTEGQRQEVVVTDVHMRFGSMVVFMVKWAIASIPAFLILLILIGVFWGTVLGFVSSLSSGHHGSGSAPTTSSSGSDKNTDTMSAEESAYLQKVEVRKVTVGKSVLDEAGAFGEIKNTGDRTLKEVEITIYCLGADGKPVFEKTYDPVLVTELGYGENSKALKPGYSRQFGVKLEDAPSDWTKKVEVKVTRVAFQ